MAMARVGADGDEIIALAARVADAYATIPGVAAVAWSGSRAGDDFDGGSDIDLYVYADQEIPISLRATLAAGYAGAEADVEIDNRFWEPGDEWRDAATGVWVDVMYRSPAWIEAELDRVLVRHEAQVGYSTAVWATVRDARALEDPSGWFRRLHERAAS